MTIEIIFDACRKKDFQAMEKLLWLADSIGTLGEIEPEDPNLPITFDNLKTEVPKLIAALARELGVENIDPKKLKSSDTLYALMGFDHTKTLSLSKSIQAQFNVIGKVGGDRMVTVGNALNFARRNDHGR